MTNKEAKEKLYIEWQKSIENNIDYAGISEAYKTAFKALDQTSCEDAKSILDKIRAEIEHHRRKTESIDPYDLVGDCLDIIDKYKAESER